MEVGGGGVLATRYTTRPNCFPKVLVGCDTASVHLLKNTSKKLILKSGARPPCFPQVRMKVRRQCFPHALDAFLEVQAGFKVFGPKGGESIAATRILW